MLLHDPWVVIHTAQDNRDRTSTTSIGRSRDSSNTGRIGSHLGRLDSHQVFLQRNLDADCDFLVCNGITTDNARIKIFLSVTRNTNINLQRLCASVGQKRLNTDLAGDSEAGQSTATPDDLLIKTPWNEIDDVLYEARGASWALVHCLKAVEIDFADVLQKKNALVSLRQIIRELEATQETIWSPVVLNGSGFGLFANHSLVMASYVSRANAGIIDLRELLTKG